MDLGGGEGGEFAPAQAGVGGEVGHQLIDLVPGRPGPGRAWPHQRWRGSPTGPRTTPIPRRRSLRVLVCGRSSPGCQCTSFSRGLTRYPPVMPGGDQGGDAPCHPGALSGGGRGVHRLPACRPVVMSSHGRGPMTGARYRVHNRRWVSVCLRDHCPSGGVPVLGTGSRRSAPLPGCSRPGASAVSRVRDLLQLGGQPLPRSPTRTAAGARSHTRPPATGPRLPRRVHRHPGIHLHHHTTSPQVGSGGGSHDALLGRAVRTRPVMQRCVVRRDARRATVQPVRRPALEPSRRRLAAKAITSLAHQR